jgi:EmrB/QacA subfamily drug resistance transporter
LSSHSPLSTSGSDQSAAPQRLVAALALAATLMPLGSTSIAVAIPSIALDIHRDAASLTQWLVTSYLVVNIVGQGPGGKVADLVGHRRALALGQIAFGAGTLVGAFANGLAMLVVARMLMATGGALMGPATFALVRVALPSERRGRAFALLGSLMSFAAGIGPTLGGEINARLGWRTIFLVNIPLLLGSALLARSGESPVARERPRDAIRFDVVGTIVLAVGLVAMLAGSKMPMPRGAMLLVVGVAMLVGFVSWERRTPQPLMDLALFRERAFVAGAVVIALQNLAMYSLLFQLPAYFAEVRHIGSDRVGRALLAMMASVVIGGPIGARLAERSSARIVVTCGCAASLAGLFLLRHLGTLPRPGDAVPGLVLVGIGLGLSGPPAQAAAMGAAPAEQSGMAAGVQSTLRYLGGIVGIALLGAYLRDAHGAHLAVQHSRAVTAYMVSLALATVIALGLPGTPVTTAHRRVPTE